MSEEDIIEPEVHVDDVPQAPITDVADAQVQPEAQEAAPETPKTPEDEAREMGWKPKDEFDGDPDNWEPAKKFLKTKKVFSVLEETRNELKKTNEEFNKYKQGLEEYKKFQKETIERNIREDMQRLQKEAEIAKSAGDVDTAVDLSIRAKALENQLAPKEAPNLASSDYIGALAKLETHLKPMSLKNPSVMRYAEAVEAELEQSGQNHLTFSEKADIILEKVKSVFPDLALPPDNAQTRVPTAVLPARTGTHSEAKVSVSLTPSQKHAWETMKQYYTGKNGFKEFCEDNGIK